MLIVPVPKKLKVILSCVIIVDLKKVHANSVPCPALWRILRGEGFL